MQRRSFLISCAAALVARGTAIAQMPSGNLPSFRLLSPQTGLLPFTVGMPFAKGAARPGAVALSIADAQVVAMRNWNDGSIKHAIISGHAPLAADRALDVTVTPGSLGGTRLTAADIRKAAPQATVDLGNVGKASLADLLAEPIRTFVSGPEMVECHYKQKTAAGLLVLFHVRLYKKGRLWVRVICENGYQSGSVDVGPYTATVVIGGAPIFSSPLKHYANTSWVQEGWIGGDPEVRPIHDMRALVATKLVPNYFMDPPDTVTLDALYQRYVPLQSGGWTPEMETAGPADQIGLLPKWDVLVLTSLGDRRAWTSMIANAKAIRSYAIAWRNPANDLPVTPSAMPRGTPLGVANPNSPDGTGRTVSGGGGLHWEINHHGSAGYLAYLLTGEYFHLETMQLQASLCYLSRDPETFGRGLDRYISAEVRGHGWSMRTIGQMCALCPDGDPMLKDYQKLLDNMCVSDIARKNAPGFAPLGWIDPSQGNMASWRSPALNGGVPVDSGTEAPWMQAFVVASYGMVSDLEPLLDMSNWNAVRDFQYRFSVGLFGPGTSGTYCFNYANVYGLLVVPSLANDGDIRHWFPSWGALYNDVHNINGAACGNTLQGAGGGGNPGLPDGFFADEMPALAYAVDHGAPGALSAYARVTNAANYATYRNATAGSRPGYGNTPQWGIKPRAM